MSAAIQIPQLWAAQTALEPRFSACTHVIRRPAKAAPLAKRAAEPPSICWAFYRKHTESLLRRYLYASTQIGRTPNLLADSVERGWVSSCKIRTFEDALIFVLDVERCLKRLCLIDQQLIARVVVQEYTHAEAAALLGIGLRSVYAKLPQALDRLTESLIESRLLSLPD